MAFALQQMSTDPISGSILIVIYRIKPCVGVLEPREVDDYTAVDQLGTYGILVTTTPKYDTSPWISPRKVRTRYIGVNHSLERRRCVQSAARLSRDNLNRDKLCPPEYRLPFSRVVDAQDTIGIHGI